MGIVNDIKSAVSGHAHPNTIYHALYAYFFLYYSAAFIAKVFGKTRQCMSNWGLRMVIGHTW